MPKKIDEKVKIIAIKKYMNGEKLENIANELNLKSGPPIIKYWIKRYNLINEEICSGLECELDLFMKKDIENELLKSKLLN